MGLQTGDQYKVRRTGHYNFGDVVVPRGRNCDNKCICHLPGESDTQSCFLLDEEDLTDLSFDPLKLTAEQEKARSTRWKKTWGSK